MMLVTKIRKLHVSELEDILTIHKTNLAYILDLI